MLSEAEPKKKEDGPPEQCKQQTQHIDNWVEKYHRELSVLLDSLRGFECLVKDIFRPMEHVQEQK